MKKRTLRTFVLLLVIFVLVIIQVLVVLPSGSKQTLSTDDETVSSSDTSESDTPISSVTETDVSIADISVTDAPDADLNQYATVCVKSATMRKSASSDSKKIDYINKDERVIVLGSDGNWYNIDFNGTVGWVHSDCLTLIRNHDLEATMYLPIPQQVSGETQSLSGTATAMHIDRISSEQKADGVAVAVIRNGEVAYSYEYGYADLKHTRKVTASTKFRSASLSKVFTAMLAMKLVDDGILDLDEDIGKVYGKTIRNPEYKYTAITTRMLLSHTSSFKDKNPIFSGSFYQNLEDKKSYSSYSPGSSFRYSNFGYGIAGAVIERHSGMVLSKYADSAYFEKLGIDASYDGRYLDEKKDVADCIETSKLGLSAADVVKKKTEYDPGYNFSLGAGGLIINASDMAKLVCILANYGTYDGERYLKTDTVSQMFEKQYDTNGFDQCIALRRSNSVIPNREVYYHTGSAYGVFTFIVFDPSDGSGVVVFSTGASDAEDSIGAREICSEIATLIYGDVFDR